MTGDWNAYATQNGAANLDAGSVVGNTLWDYVAGVETVGFLNALFFWTLREESAFSMPVRCDMPFSPALYRMAVRWTGHDSLEIAHEAMQAPNFPKKHPIPTETIEATHRCSFCCKYEVDGLWLESFEHPSIRYETAAHTICEPCRTTLLKASKIQLATTQFPVPTRRNAP